MYIRAKKNTSNNNTNNIMMLMENASALDDSQYNMFCYIIFIIITMEYQEDGSGG
jgi:hypothetical protein